MSNQNKVIIVTFSDSKYFTLLKDLILSIKKFDQSKNVDLGILDGGLENDQIDFLKKHTKYIKKAEWDIDVSKLRVRNREYLKNHVCRPFLPKYFEEFDTYIWLDCDTWVNDWNALEYLINGCVNGKLAAVQTISPGYRDIAKVKWLFGGLAFIKTQNFKHAKSSGFSRDIIKKVSMAPNINAGVFALQKKFTILEKMARINKKSFK